MALLTSTEVRTHVETGLVDAALQRIMDAAEEDIDQKFGAVSSQVDDLEGKLKSVWTTRPISSITSVVETLGTDDTTLASDDYAQRHGMQLDRLTDGTNGRRLWGDRVKVTYTPTDTTDRRTAVYIRLIKLDVEYKGLASERAGDYNSASFDYTREREKILSGLRNEGLFV
jgi:hypothetical protein